MLATSLPLHSPLDYSGLWLLIGSLLVVAVASWYGFIFWLTSRKKLNSLANLKPASTVLNLDMLKTKYLKLIDECYESYQQKHTTLRGLHRGLSMTVRYFVYEAKQFPAPRLTLADLKRAPYPALTLLIAEYYANEFAVIENGDPLKSVAAAKELIQQWV